MKAARISNHWSLLMLCLLGIHIGWGAARIPGRVYGKRFKQIREYLQHGGPAYHLDNRHRQGAAQVQFILDQTEENSLLLWRGEAHGCMEFVPPLIAPRLLVSEDTCPPNATHMFGRPLAQGKLADGSSGVLVMVGFGDHLALVLR